LIDYLTYLNNALLHLHTRFIVVITKIIIISLYSVLGATTKVQKALCFSENNISKQSLYPK